MTVTHNVVWKIHLLLYLSE